MAHARMLEEHYHKELEDAAEFEQCYQEKLRAVIDLKLNFERANASCRDVRYRLELCLDRVFQKLASAGCSSPRALSPCSGNSLLSYTLAPVNRNCRLMPKSQQFSGI
jgi:hypothetical protein